jgi:flagellar motor switch protein FliN/FliY
VSDEIQFEGVTETGLTADAADLGRLAEVPVELAVEIGRTTMTIGETLALGPGSIVSLNRLAGEPVDLLVNGRTIAVGEVVVIDEEFGLRITEDVAPARHLRDGEAGGFEAAPDAGFEAPPIAVEEPVAVAEEPVAAEPMIEEVAVEEAEASVSDDAVIEAPEEPVEEIAEPVSEAVSDE